MFNLKELKAKVPLKDEIVKLIKVDLVKDQQYTICPFHEDKKPSLTIKASTNLWYCHACQEGGSVIDWVMKAEGVGIGEAIRRLAERYPQYAYPESNQAQLKSIKEALKPTSVTKVESPKLPQPQEVLKQALGHYNHNLNSNEFAKKYLLNRGVTERAIEEFNIGLCDNSVGKILRNRQHDPDGTRVLIEELHQTGLLVKKDESFFERFYGSIVIPIYNDKADVTEVYGRKIVLQQKQRVHQYLPGKHGGFFNYEHLVTKQPKEVILCESIFDALSFWVHGFHNVTASYGVSGFTGELRQFILDNASKLYIAYDNDNAGNLGAEKLYQDFGQQVQCLRVNFNPGQDANQFILTTKTPKKDLEQLVANATSMATKAA